MACTITVTKIELNKLIFNVPYPFILNLRVSIVVSYESFFKRKKKRKKINREIRI